MEIRPTGVAHGLRTLGRRLVPRSRVRSALDRLLRSFEQRRGIPFVVGDQTLRFLPFSNPYIISDQNAEQHDIMQLTAFAEAIRGADIVADVGAHLGEYTVVAAARVGERGHVHAFEPAAVHNSTILRNLRINGLEGRVTIVNSVVAAKSGTVSFFTWEGSSANSLLRTALEPHAKSNLKETAFPATSLDDYFAQGTLPNVVKIDVEGAELTVLQGAERIVRSDALIFCELHPYAWLEAGHSAQDLRDWLRERGRNIVEIDSDREVEELTYGPVRLVKAER
jgi:FkbM family methyltransferase